MEMEIPCPRVNSVLTSYIHSRNASFQIDTKERKISFISSLVFKNINEKFQYSFAKDDIKIELLLIMRRNKMKDIIL